MASEAVIDSRDFEIITAEEVEDLKKEHQVLNSRLEAMTKKLALETKIRDAALSLSKVNASHKKVSKQTSEQLEAANKRVESAQKEIWKISDRVNEVHRRLMEHRAGVLSFSVRNMEKKMAREDSGYDSSNRSTLMSPTMTSNTGLSSPTTTVSSSKSRFDGAHLFAGHADSIVPKVKLSSEAAAAAIAALEAKLQTAKDSLAAAGKKQVEMTRELSLMKLEKQEVETMMGMDIQAAEETIAALEKEIPRLEELDSEVRQLRQEKTSWERDRVGFETRLMELEMRKSEDAGGVERTLASIRESMQKELEAKEAEIRRIQEERESERSAWMEERQQLEDEKMDDLARLQEEMDRMRDEEDQTIRQSQDEMSSGLAILQSMVRTHGIVLFSRDSSLQGLLNAIGMHIESVHTKLETYSKAEAEWESLRRRLEEDVRSGLDKREALARELEDVRRDRDSARRDTLTLESRVKSQPPPSSSHLRTPSTSFESSDSEVSRIISILQPLWTTLPSPEARAAKFVSTNRPFRTGSPVSGSSTSSPSTVSSLSDLDVRSLKSLYDTRQNGPASPLSPKSGTNGLPAPFTIEAFAARVQALVNDDKALIERLLRFAQAHDLLKKNAERAQKLAQDGTHALEAYQKQTRILEERNMSMAARQSALQEELQLLHDTIERITAERRELESLAAEQAQTCQQLTEANNTLSARALALAEEAAHAPEMMRKQYETQLQELKKALELAQDEVDAMRTSEQSQRIALLDELNSMQTENGSLRAQLRAAKK